MIGWTPVLVVISVALILFAYPVGMLLDTLRPRRPAAHAKDAHQAQHERTRRPQ